MAAVAFSLEPVPPFRLDLTTWALRRRTHNAVDRWDGRHWRRALASGNRVFELCVSQHDTRGPPRLDVVISGVRIGEHQRQEAEKALDRLLGVSIDLQPFYALAATDPRLARLADRFRGVKPVRFPGIFESLVNAIACQQLSLDAGIHLLNALTLRYGEAVGRGRAALRAFPSPVALADVSVEALRTLGFSRQNARALIELSGALARGTLDLEALAGRPDGSLRTELQSLRGIGRWSAEYTMLRGYGRLQQFPADDVGAWRGLQRWLRLRKPLDYGRAIAITRRWRPYAGFVYFHLLLGRLEHEGWIKGSKAGCGDSGSAADGAMP